METNKIYIELHKKIVNLNLLPESVLNLSEIAKIYDVSRTPVKEALILLQVEGLVIRHGSHFMVTPLSLDRIREITEIRLVLEVQTHIWAMNRAEEKEKKELRNIKDKILTLEKSARKKRIVELDYEFHRLMYKAAKNTQLTQFLEKLLCHYTRFWLYIAKEVKPANFFKETLKMIDAVENKDENAIRRSTTAHITESVEEITSFISSKRP